MLKSLTRLWMRSAKRIAKAQQAQQKKLVKTLLKKPAAKKTPKINAGSSKRPRPSSVTAKAVSSASSIPLPGKWLSSFYISSSADGTASRRMRYLLYLPSTTASGPLPLVVMLHGCEQNASQFAQGSGMNQLAEEKGFAVLYPQQSLRSHRNRCWTWYDNATQAGGGDVELIVGIIEKVTRDHAIDRRRIYIAGMSAGASMANIVALNHPYLIAAVGLHSGTVFGCSHSKMSAYALMQRGALKSVETSIEKVRERFGTFPTMPAILIHGQSDKVVRPINLVQLTRQFRLLNQLPTGSDYPAVIKAAGKPGSRKPAHAFVTRDHRIGRKVILRTCEILQLEHAWSGGDGTLRFNSSAGPNATKMMWSFFSKHRRFNPVLEVRVKPAA
jgi:poly(hydroxyalkanoate) depolymerase family esterase